MRSKIWISLLWDCNGVKCEHDALGSLELSSGMTLTVAQGVLHLLALLVLLYARVVLTAVERHRCRTVSCSHRASELRLVVVGRRGSSQLEAQTVQRRRRFCAASSGAQQVSESA